MTSSPLTLKQSLKSPRRSSGLGTKAALQYKNKLPAFTLFSGLLPLLSPPVDEFGVAGNLRILCKNAMTYRTVSSAPIWNLYFFISGADPTAIKWTLTLDDDAGLEDDFGLLFLVDFDGEDKDECGEVSLEFFSLILNTNFIALIFLLGLFSYHDSIFIQMCYLQQFLTFLCSKWSVYNQ